MLLGDLERGRRALHRGHVLRAAGQRRDREAARVAERIEHFAARGERAHALPVVALVEEEPGLLSRLDVDAEMQAVLDDRAALRLAVAPGKSGPRRQALQRAHLRIRALVD